MLGDHVAVDLARLRAEAESLMCDWCRVERPLFGHFDEGTGQYVDTWALVYTGPSRVRTTDTMQATPTASGVEFTLQRVLLQVPVSDATSGVRIGDRVTVTSGGFDPSWLSGRSFTVVADQSSTHAVMRRFPCEEIR